MQERTSGYATAAPYGLIYADAQDLLRRPLWLIQISNRWVTDVVHLHDLCCQLYVTSAKNTMSTGDHLWVWPFPVDDFTECETKFLIF